MVPVVHVLSLLVFSKLLRAFLCIIFRRGFLLGRQPCDQFDAVCGIWSEHWQADPPPLQPLQQCWQHSNVYFPNTTSGYDTQLLWFDHGEACSEWKPVLLNRCMVLATVLQLSFRVWQSSYSLRHLYVEQQFFFSDPQRVLCHEVPLWTSSDQYEITSVRNCIYIYIYIYIYILTLAFLNFLYSIYLFSFYLLYN